MGVVTAGGGTTGANEGVAGGGGARRGGCRGMIKSELLWTCLVEALFVE